MDMVNLLSWHFDPYISVHMFELFQDWNPHIFENFTLSWLFKKYFLKKLIAVVQKPQFQLCNRKQNQQKNRNYPAKKIPCWFSHKTSKLICFGRYFMNNQLKLMFYKQKKLGSNLEMAQTSKNCICNMTRGWIYT